MATTLTRPPTYTAAAEAARAGLTGALPPQLSALLTRYGLASLTRWAQSAIINGLSEDEIQLQLFDRPEFKARFPAIFAREQAGLPPVSPTEYLAYEAFASQAAKAFGITLSKTDVDAMLTADVSTAEMQDRMGIAATAVFQSPPEVRAELNRLYGVTEGDLISYWLDPKTKAPILQRRFAAAQIAGEAQRAGFRDDLSAMQAESLFEAGVDTSSAREGFASLVEGEQLFEAVDVTEEDIGTTDQLSLLTGNVRLAEQVQTRGERRAARFQEGGAFSAGRTGLAGLGSANK